MNYLSKIFRKNVYCHLEFEDDIEKMVGVQEVIQILKSYSKIKKKIYALFMNGMGNWIVFRTSLVPPLPSPRSVKPFSRKLDFLIFQNSFITFVKKMFSSWYLGWIYLVIRATYSRHMDQIRAGAPRPSLSCYGLYLAFAFITDLTIL